MDYLWKYYNGGASVPDHVTRHEIITNRCSPSPVIRHINYARGRESICPGKFGRTTQWPHDNGGHTSRCRELGLARSILKKKKEQPTTTFIIRAIRGIRRMLRDRGAALKRAFENKPPIETFSSHAFSNKDRPTFSSGFRATAKHHVSLKNGRRQLRREKVTTNITLIKRFRRFSLELSEHVAGVSILASTVASRSGLTNIKVVVCLQGDSFTVPEIPPSRFLRMDILPSYVFVYDLLPRVQENFEMIYRQRCL
ncbi:hypothetical protein EVAR_97211_1 [Eumeta japonica]|uniref:Uncharacterized protein n=1 Tax=Eumeta variegata TaxID=151549 RepID=A0A4C1WIN5_EUMVA|nr:hypothetical protein EVAR_97211_1 [Eumeta japonica]